MTPIGQGDGVMMEPEAPSFGPVQVVSFALLLLVGIGGSLHAYSLGIWRDQAPAEGLFPFCASMGLVVVCGLALLLGHFRRKGTGTTPSTRRKREVPRAGTVACYVIALGAYAFLIEAVGFALSTAAVLVLILRASENHRWTTVLVMTAMTTVLSSLLFIDLLGVYFPSGWIWSALGLD